MQSEAKEFREIMRQIVRKFGILEDDEKSCCGITLTQCHSLVEIGRAGAVSLCELTEIMGLDKSTLSRTVDQLVRNGYIKKETDDKNRRYITITLTPKGHKEYEGIEISMNSYFEEILECIPGNIRAQVIESTRMILSALRAVDDKHSMKA